MVTVIGSLAQVRVAITDPLVEVDGTYSIIAVGEVVSILFTIAVVEPVFPAASMNVKVYDPLDVKV